MSRDYTVLVTNRAGHVKQVQRRDLKHHPIADHRVFTLKRRKGYSQPRRHFTRAEANHIKDHFRRSGFRVEVARGRSFPWLILAPGARWPKDRKLLRGMNDAARSVGRRIKIISGFRSTSEARRLYYGWTHRLPGYNLAAYCCPATSEHCRGLAADAGWITSRGKYLSVGKWRTGLNALSRHNVSLTVRTECWHLSFDPRGARRNWQGY
jgi:hypothetical protein